MIDLQHCVSPPTEDFAHARLVYKLIQDIYYQDVRCMGAERFNTVIRTYPDGSKCVKFLSRNNYAGGEQVPDFFRKMTPSEKSLYNSTSRTRVQIFDLARANSWDWFITLTLDKRKVDRYTYDEIVPRMEMFTKYLRYHKCKYLIVPELHQDGAYHFHGLVAGPLPVEWWRYDRLKSGERVEIYQISGYQLGRNEATRVTDPSRVSTYISKYVTKSTMQAVPKGKRRYWASSRSLEKPQKERAELDGNQLDSLIRMAIYHTAHTDPNGKKIITLYLDSVKDDVRVDVAGANAQAADVTGTDDVAIPVLVDPLTGELLT